jgi:hypothetical protein
MTDTTDITADADVSNAQEGADASVDSAINNDMVHALREENKKWRLKYKEKNTELESFKADTDTKLKTANETAEMTARQKAVFEKKYINAELKAKAIAAGIKDVDLVKLIDISSLDLSEEGEVNGLDDAINAFKEQKPAFFGDDKRTSTSSNAPAPKSNKQTAPLDVRSLDDEEYEQAKKRLLRGH